MAARAACMLYASSYAAAGAGRQTQIEGEERDGVGSDR